MAGRTTPAKASGVTKKAAGTTKKASAKSAATERRTQTRTKVRSQRSAVLRDALKGITAAAEVLDDRSKPKATTQSPTRMWQHAVAGYAHTVPELNAGKMYVGNCLARIKLKVGKRNADGTVDLISDGVTDKGEDGKPKDELPEGVTEDTYNAAAEVIATVRSPLGGQSELLRSFGEKAFTVGEAYLLPEDSPAGLTFEVLSFQELSKEADKWVVHNGPGGDTEDVPPGIEPVRIWRPDDVYRRQATSSVRACLEILEELVLLTKLVRSSAISRMALAGILLIAEEFDDDLDDESPDGQQSEQASPLLVDMVMNGVKAIDDPASAASWFPYLLSGPKDLIKDGVNFVEFKHDDAINVVKRREALERLAQGLDLPFEVILGHQGTTFANAQVISEDTFRVHLEPTIQLFCDAVTLGILWPALAKQQGLTAEQVRDAGYPDDILSVAVTFDPSDLIGRPDKAKDIVELFVKDLTQSAVRISEVRNVLQLDPDDGPDAEETARRLEAYRFAHEKPQAVADTGTTVSGMEAIEGTGVTAALYLADGLAHRIAGAAELTLERCAERVGATCRPKLTGAQLEAVGSATNAEMSRILGPSVVTRMLGKTDPIPAEISTFERSVARWAKDSGQRHPGQLAKAAGMVLRASVDDRLYSAEHPTLDVESLDSLAASAASTAA